MYQIGCALQFEYSCFPLRRIEKGRVSGRRLQRLPGTRVEPAPNSGGGEVSKCPHPFLKWNPGIRSHKCSHPQRTACIHEVPDFQLVAHTSHVCILLHPMPPFLRLPAIYEFGHWKMELLLPTVREKSHTCTITGYEVPDLHTSTHTLPHKHTQITSQAFWTSILTSV